MSSIIPAHQQHLIHREQIRKKRENHCHILTSSLKMVIVALQRYLICLTSIDSIGGRSRSTSDAEIQWHRIIMRI
jgi:hypothetical protein